MLNLRFSNSVQRLAAGLLAQMAEPPASPFAAEPVIVGSAGVARWLALRYADAFGVCAGVEFSFPAQWIWRSIARAGGGAPESPFTAERLAWRLFAWFDTAEAQHAPRLGQYLSAADPAMRWELATRVAATLERYVAYRPDWLAAWAEGRSALPGEAAHGQRADERWQALAWRRVLSETGASREHPARALFDALAREGPQRLGLPARLQLFALPAVPPLYLDIFRRLGEWIDVSIHALNPSRDFWFDLDSPKRRPQAAREAGTEGNRLLAAWAQPARACIELLLEASAGDFDEDYRPPAGGTLLARLQRSILDNAPLVPGSLAGAAGDGSLQVHVCHGLARELEVLHDALLDRFERDPTLGPGDVLVTVPDIAEAAPLIDAVFGAAAGARRIPYAITGRPVTAFPLLAAFLQLLDLPRSRYEASGVFDLLRVPAVARRFGLEEEQALESAHRWMRESGMRWGIDERHRAALGSPGDERHTLRGGLSALLLGLLLPSGADSELTDALPYGDVEGQEAFALGGLARFIEEIGRLPELLSGERPVPAWTSLLRQLVAGFVDPAPEDAAECERLLAALAELDEHAREGGCAARGVDFAVLRAALADRLAAGVPGAVPSGRVTFAGLSPLRGLPYRLVCCLGLDQGAIPGRALELEFDLMAAFPRRGDRQRRLDERNVFLDLLLAAGDAVHLSYTGRSRRDNAPLPPSVLLAELLDAVETAALPADPEEPARRALRRTLVTEHPLQPFSERYFDAADPRLFSYDEELCAARAGGEAQPVELPFFGAALPAPETLEFDLDALARFLKHPVRHLLRERLGLRLDGDEALLEDEDPFRPGFEEESLLGQALLAALDAGCSPEQALSRAARHAAAAPGVLGRVDAGSLLEQAIAFRSRLARARRAPALAAPEIDIAEPGWRLTGRIECVSEAGLLRERFGRDSPKDRIDAWVRHLALCALGGGALRTQFIGAGACFHFGPVDGARELLGALAGLYREGWTRPLPFFLRSGLRYLEKESLDAALQCWRGDERRPGEGRDPWHRLAFRDAPDAPVGAEFEALSRAVLGPLLAHLVEGIHDAFA